MQTVLTIEVANVGSADTRAAACGQRPTKNDKLISPRILASTSHGHDAPGMARDLADDSLQMHLAGIPPRT
jgi:hypothetical protein